MANQVVLITGASSGIGKATAELLMKKGFRVYGTSRRAGKLAPEAHTSYDEESGGYIDIIPMDVTDDASVDSAVKAVILKEGRLDVLVSNAGTGIAGSAEDTTVEEAKAQFETNFFGTLRSIKAVLSIFRKQGFGKIIAIGSVAGVIAIPYQAHYSASKFAIEGLIDALRHEISPFGIKACVVEPGDTKTEFTSSRVISVNSNDSSPYYNRFKRSVARMEHDEQNGAPPIAVAKVIYSMIKRKNPPARIAVGFSYKTIFFLKRLLPSWIAEKIVSMLYN